MPFASTNWNPNNCYSCKGEANLELKTSRPFCDDCWNRIKAKISATMKRKRLKRTFMTRAAMAASKKVNRKAEPRKWKLFHDYYYEQMLRRIVAARKYGKSLDEVYKV